MEVTKLNVPNRNNRIIDADAFMHSMYYFEFNNLMESLKQLEHKPCKHSDGLSCYTSQFELMLKLRSKGTIYEIKNILQTQKSKMDW